MIKFVNFERWCRYYFFYYDLVIIFKNVNLEKEFMKEICVERIIFFFYGLWNGFFYKFKYIWVDVNDNVIRLDDGYSLN